MGCRGDDRGHVGSGDCPRSISPGNLDTIERRLKSDGMSRQKIRSSSPREICLLLAMGISIEANVRTAVL